MAGRDKNLHAGHRSRIRKQFIKCGNLDAFEDHQILELLLFYAYPMRDTNEIAHKLLKKYGSLYNLFNMPAQNLMQYGGLTENVAVLISMMPFLFRRYIGSEFKNSVVLKNYRDAKKFMMSMVIGQNYESFFIINLDSKRKVISVNEITENSVDKVIVNSRFILENTLLSRAKFVIIGHNHPAGSDRPSRDDMKFTQNLINEYSSIDVKVLDHIIVFSDSAFSFCENNLYKLTYNPE